MIRNLRSMAPVVALVLPLAGCGGEKADPIPAAMGQCVACHSFAKNGPQRSGPNLYGIFGKAAGSAPGYSYSSALQQSGIVWSADTLDAYLAAPRDLVPGTRMTFSGEPDAAKRHAMITYMRQQTDEVPRK